MNRFKRELRARGYKLEQDYECLPADGVETVVANAETAMLSIYHVSVGWLRVGFDRAMQEVIA